MEFELILVLLSIVVIAVGVMLFFRVLKRFPILKYALIAFSVLWLFSVIEEEDYDSTDGYLDYKEVGDLSCVRFVHTYYSKPDWGCFPKTFEQK